MVWFTVNCCTKGNPFIYTTIPLKEGDVSVIKRNAWNCHLKKYSVPCRKYSIILKGYSSISSCSFRDHSAWKRQQYILLTDLDTHVRKCSKHSIFYEICGRWERWPLSLSIYILYACIIYIYIHTDTDTHVTFMHLPKPLKRVKHTLYDSPAMHNRGLLVTRDDELTPHFLKGIWYFDIFGVSVLLNCLFRRTILGVSQNWQTENSWKSLKIIEHP